MIEGIKAASWLNKFYVFSFALFFAINAVQLNGMAFVWLALTVSVIRILELENDLRNFGVDP